MKFSQIPVKSVPTLLTKEELFERLALESTIGGNVLSLFTVGLPTIVSKLKGYLTVFPSLHSNQPIDLIDRSFRALDATSLDKRYLNYREILVQTPEGFKGEFLEFAVVLTEIGEHLYKDTEILFEENKRALSDLISNPNKYAKAKDLSNNYAKFTKAIEQLEKKLKAFFDDGSLSRRRLIDVVPQHSQLRDLNRQVKVLSKMIDHRELKKIKSMTQEITGLLEVIERQLKSDDIHDISSETVKTIATGTYEIARYIDFIVSYTYATMSLIGSVNVLFEQLKELK